MIKTLDVSLGLIAPSQVDPPGVLVPTISPEQVIATGYYTDPVTGQLYYYDAIDDQWYYYAAGYIYPLGISWKPSPSPKIDLIGGVDTLRLRLSFKYIGPAMTQRFYATIGENKTSGTFDEWSGYNTHKDIPLTRYDTPTLITDKYLDIVIPPDGHDGEDGAVYCKKDQYFIEEGKDSTPCYYNVCHIVKAEGEFTDMVISKFEKV